MQIQTLRSFLNLANSGSISSCSRQMNISQQGLSRQLQSLESEVGVTLIKRSHRGISLTAAGQAAVPMFQQVVNDYDKSLARLAAFRDEQVETLRLFVCPGIRQALGLDFFFRFQKKHSQIKLDLQFGEDAVCEQALQNNDADAAFLVWPHHPDDYLQHLVVKSRLVGVMRHDDPLAQFRPLSMERLAGVQVYFPDESNYMSQRFRKHWPRYYAQVRRTVSSNDYESFYRLPQQLGGVALTFAFLCHHLEKGLVAVPIKEPSYVEIFFCRRKSHQLTSGLWELEQYVQDHVHLVEGRDN